jgi:hypothetical protein
MFEQMTGSIDDEVQLRLVDTDGDETSARQRGATWTYLTTDEPFGPLTQRIIKGVIRMLRRK